jgi:hypothetical protein
MVTRTDLLPKVIVNRRVDIVQKTIILNFIILSVLIISKFIPALAYAGGLLILIYLSVLGLIKPKSAFYIIFGIKLTYDILWNIGRGFAGLPSIHLLSLFLIPILIVMLLGPRIKIKAHKTPLWFSAFYILWVLMSVILNNNHINFEIIIKQSGIFFGLFLGLKYINDKDDFNLLVFLIFISTLIPVITSFVQFVMGSMGKYILYFTADSVIDLRYAGLYHDAATNGMVNLICLFSNAYIIRNGFDKKWQKILHLFIFTISLLVIIIGSTRSVLIIAAITIIIIVFRDIKRWLIAIPLITLALYFGKPFLDKTLDKSQTDISKEVHLNKILTEDEYRRMLTGRVSIWQDIWNNYKRKTYLQQLFGSGLSTDAHSSYFYLLLQIGWLGMIYYLYLNFFLLYKFLRIKKLDQQVLLGILFLLSILLLGISTNTILYTSYQWTSYIIIGGVINFSLLEKTGRNMRYRYT